MSMSAWFHNSSLTSRVMLALVGVLALALGVIAVLASQAAGRQINQSAAHEADLVAQTVSQAITELVILGDFPAIEQHLRRRATQPDTNWLRFTDAQGQVVAAQRPPQTVKHPAWFSRLLGVETHSAASPIEAGGAVYGTLSVQVNTLEEESQAWTLAVNAALLFTLAIGLCAVFIHLIVRKNLQGLMAMRAMAEKLERGDFAARIAIDTVSPPEIRETAGVLNYAVNRISELMAEMRRMAFHDPLTGLPNRRAIEGRLERALRLARQKDQIHIFCYIDLDQFKIVNDTCGHAAGDQLLAQLPQILGPLLPGSAYLARLGGDEFGLLLFDTTMGDAEVIARKVIDAIHDHSFIHGGHSYQLGASIGMTSITRDTQNESEILAQADMACYTAKEAGRNRSHVYENAQSGVRALQEEMEWVSWFNEAMAEDRLVLYRQRVDALNDSAARPHYEILLRIRRYADVIESPGPFLAAAEKHGLSPELDRYMVRKMCQWLAEHPHDPATYSVNLSGLSLSDEFLLDCILKIMDTYQIPGDRLSFEITETAAVQNLTHARRLIEGLKARGCAFYLDDFGKGMASFSYLKQLPADYLKIDGSFVLEMLRDPTDYAIINAFNQIAHDLSRKSVAECVENPYQLDKLREIGVDYVQGFGIHRPEPLPELKCAADSIAA